MKSIGVRAETKNVFYAVLTGSRENPVLVEDSKLNLQADASAAEAYQILRTEFQTILKHHAPDILAIRFPEPSLATMGNKALSNLGSFLERSRIEGVLMESAASMGIEVVSRIAVNIKSGMDTDKSFKAYIGGDEVRGIDLRKKKNDKLREAIFSGISVLGDDE